uniref:Uncharacterized protein n=1 Tax=Rhizophora mucronata TaxID=61149 RepID=A0A2P2P516_RHIMU
MLIIFVFLHILTFFFNSHLIFKQTAFCTRILLLFLLNLI